MLHCRHMNRVCSSTVVTPLFLACLTPICSSPPSHRIVATLIQSKERLPF
uniref:Uncharacterized protein n=1 Tax=Anguilla anguilla TaxID=7936 RepID=A0A0E9UCW4_ANGAN